MLLIGVSVAIFAQANSDEPEKTLHDIAQDIENYEEIFAIVSPEVQENTYGEVAAKRLFHFPDQLLSWVSPSKMLFDATMASIEKEIDVAVGMGNMHPSFINHVRDFAENNGIITAKELPKIESVFIAYLLTYEGTLHFASIYSDVFDAKYADELALLDSTERRKLKFWCYYFGIERVIEGDLVGTFNRYLEEIKKDPKKKFNGNLDLHYHELAEITYQDLRGGNIVLDVDTSSLKLVSTSCIDTVYTNPGDVVDPAVGVKIPNYAPVDSLWQLNLESALCMIDGNWFGYFDEKHRQYHLGTREYLTKNLECDPEIIYPHPRADCNVNAYIHVNNRDIDDETGSWTGLLVTESDPSQIQLTEGELVTMGFIYDFFDNPIALGDQGGFWVYQIEIDTISSLSISNGDQCQESVQLRPGRRAWLDIDQIGCDSLQATVTTNFCENGCKIDWLSHNSYTDVAISELPDTYFSVEVTDMWGGSVNVSTGYGSGNQNSFISDIKYKVFDLDDCSLEVDGFLSFTVDASIDTVQIRINDALGQEVHVQLVEANKINRIYLPTGEYVAYISDLLDCELHEISFAIGDNIIEADYLFVNGSCSQGESFIELQVVSGGLGDYSYIWNTGDETPSIYGLQNGDYSVTITDSSGCIEIREFEVESETSDIDSIILSAKSELTCSIASTHLAVRIDGSFTNNSDDFYYQWSPYVHEITEGYASVNDPGIYFVSVTDTNGCQHTASVEVLSTGLDSEMSLEDICTESSVYLYLQDSLEQYEISALNSAGVYPTELSNIFVIDYNYGDSITIMVSDSGSCLGEINHIDYGPPEFSFSVEDENCVELVANIVIYAHNSHFPDSETHDRIGFRYADDNTFTPYAQNTNTLGVNIPISSTIIPYVIKDGCTYEGDTINLFPEVIPL